MKYAKVETNEDVDSDQGITEQNETFSSPKKQHFRRFLWIIVVEHFLLVVAIFALWRTYVPPSTKLDYQILTADNKTYPLGQLSWSQHFDPLPCGRNPDEARARGCHFDMLATAWLPPRCIDHELVDEFMEVGQWEFYTRLKGTKKYNSYEPDLLGSVNRTVWTTRRWHATHCIYMFVKLNRALVNGWAVDGESISEPHTEHCMKALKGLLFGPSLDPNEVETFLEVIYPPC